MRAWMISNLALLLTMAVTASVHSAPVLVLEPTRVDWGRQAENKGEYAFTFTIKNGGDEELQITRVRPGCSCTKVELKKQSLAPGESTEMTGVLSTKGIDGPVHKGILITSNDPARQTAVADLQIRFPIDGEGLRLKGNLIAARVRDGDLWAYVTVENCQAEGDIRIEALELPEGWTCSQPLPIAIGPENRVGFALVRKVVAGSAESFDGLPFALVTDCAKTPRVQGSLMYRPVQNAAAPSPSAMAASSPPVRWPMAKPAPMMAPIIAPMPVPAGGQGPAVAPAPRSSAAGTIGPAAVP